MIGQVGSGAVRSRHKGEDIEERMLDFAARVGRVVDALPDARLGRHIAGQLVRSGTSPKLLPAKRINPLQEECEQLTKIISRSLITAKSSHPRS